ncbi:hypothetical protein ACFL07_07990 [Pseudomonadota bacterium]
MSDALTTFNRRLYDEWLPAFCFDKNRNYSIEGFRESSVTISAFDAAHFVKAIDNGLVYDTGGGRYRCPQSRAQEQLFWEGSRKVTPRPISLWLEPIITIATVARLRFDYGWPEKCLGMQSEDWAFDFVTFLREGDENEHIAGEVKKTPREINSLVSDLLEFSSNKVLDCPSDKAHVVNSFKKWKALLRRKPPLFWAVGPDNYTKVFSLIYIAENRAELHETSLDVLAYQ